MKRKVILVMPAMLLLLGCAASESDRIRSKIDAIATQTQRAAETLRDAASGAAAIGVPGAGIVALTAGAVGTIAGLFDERRRHTRPLRMAVHEIVKSVDAAFPEKTAQQKAQLIAKQTDATRQLVRAAKTA